MSTFLVLLTLAALFCGLVAGITFIFATIIMPGLATLGDRDLLRSFKAVDRVIQDNQPLFLIVWLGSALLLGAATILGFAGLPPIDRTLLCAACAIYLVGVQFSTIRVNVPLNNELQRRDLEQLDDRAIADLRRVFEPRWVRWNWIRTWIAIGVTLLLLIVLVRL